MPGKVDHGFDKKSAADLRKRRTPLIRKTQPYNGRFARGLGPMLTDPHRGRPFTRMGRWLSQSN